MTQIFANTIEELHTAMEKCEQTPGLNMLQHGQAVHAQYILLISQLKEASHPCKELQDIWDAEGESIPSPELLQRYHVYHDCGKHLCLTIDDSGRRHFPDHAEWSAKQYHRIFPEDGFTTALIRRDMDFHTARGEEICSLWKSPFAPILYFTAWAEINANAEMFGGQESESYKIKKSRLIQAGKKFLNTMKGN